jgi:hypothetical protein
MIFTLLILSCLLTGGIIGALLLGRWEHYRYWLFAAGALSETAMFILIHKQ